MKVKAVVLVLTIGFLAGCAADIYNSKTIGGNDIPKTTAGICKAFYAVAEVTAEEEPSVGMVIVEYNGKFRGSNGLLLVTVYGKDKDSVPLRVNIYEGGKLPPTVPMFVVEYMSYRGSLIVVTCGGRQGERAFNVWRKEKK